MYGVWNKVVLLSTREDIIAYIATYSSTTYSI